MLIISGKRFRPWKFTSENGATPRIELKMPTSWLFHSADGYVRIDDQELSLRSRHNYLWLIDDKETLVGRAEIEGIRSKLELRGIEHELGRKKPDDTLAVLNCGDASIGSVRIQIGRARRIEVDVPSIADEEVLMFVAAATIASWRDLLSLVTFDVGRSAHGVGAAGEGWLGGGDLGGGSGGDGGGGG